MILTSFAWGRKYLPLLERLRRTARDHGIDASLHSRQGEPPGPGAAKREKPVVLLEELALNDPVLWVDADGILQGALPEIEIDDDFGLIKNNGYWESNVILAHGTTRALATLKKWRDRMGPDFDGSDCLELNLAIGDIQPTITELPVELGWVSEWYYNRFGARQPVIELNMPAGGCCG